MTIVGVNLRVFLMILLGVLLSVYIAWLANVQVGYGYSWLYSLYETDQHIEKYAPQNRFRHNFELTTEVEHKAIFQSIVDSVHDDGRGLEAILYKANGKTYSVLHEAEIIHLQDVANLINTIHRIALFCLLLLVSLSLWHLHLRRGGQKIKASSKGLVSIGATLSLSIALLFAVAGTKNIFYQMHIWIFPQDHQWFFYYQDSLMSTLMKAPDLFAGIAIQIMLVAVVVFTLGVVCCKNFLAK